jgi:hypothetical protein
MFGLSKSLLEYKPTGTCTFYTDFNISFYIEIQYKFGWKIYNTGCIYAKDIKEYTKAFCF